MPRVTIVIPVYNAQDHIARCLDSILAQTSNDYCVLCINDGSSDGSLCILNQYEKKHPTIVRVIDQQNQGVSRTRNAGIREAKTDYIMFVDNDDYLDSDYVDTFLSEAVKTNADIVIGGYRRPSEHGTIISTYRAPDAEWTHYSKLAPWARIFRRSLLIDNDITFLENNIGEDLGFCLKAYQFSMSIKIIDYIGYNWFYNTQSVSNTIQRGLKKDCNVIPLLDSLYRIEENNISPLINYFFYRYTTWYLLFSGKSASPQRFCQMENEFSEWLNSHGFYSPLHFWNSQIKTEPIVNRLSVSILRAAHALHLVWLFALIYCRGKESSVGDE